MEKLQLESMGLHVVFGVSGTVGRSHGDQTIVWRTSQAKKYLLGAQQYLRGVLRRTSLESEKEWLKRKQEN